MPLLVSLAALLAVPAAGLAAPVISGADGDAWNAGEVPASYVISGSRPGALITWQLLNGTTTLAAFSGTGTSPLTVTLTGAPDGALTLAARQAFPLDPVRATRAFTIDTVPPTAAIARPTTGAVYQRGDRIAADYSCTGAATCAGTVAAGSPIDTSSTGPRTFTLTATDAAGNIALQRVDYRVVAGPAPPVQTLTLPAPPGGGVSLPVSNASRLKPSAGISLPFRRPVLGWKRAGSARLYNLQIFRVDGDRATKVLSVFPTRTLYRVPAGRLAFGERYVWRVWPLVGSKYAATPQGQSWFQIRRPARLTPADLLLNQRVSQAALRRTAAISAWLDQGLVAGDLREGGLGREDFAPDVVLTGAGAAIQNGVATPRPLQVAKAPPTRAKGLRVTVRQLAVNQRIAQTALRRTEALEKRIRGGLTGGDLRPGVVQATTLAPGLLVDSARPSGPAPAASRTVVAAVAPASVATVRLSDRQIQINQRIADAAIRRADALSRHIALGLTGTSFRDGTISAVSISPSLR